MKIQGSHCVVDTNVPLTANQALRPMEIPSELLICVKNCVDIIENIIDRKIVVLDADGAIFAEYSRKLSFSGQPGVGDAFLKWVHDNMGNPDHCCTINITRNGTSYVEFPVHNGLSTFDDDDRRFVAVANAHGRKPPILQATDSKWWGWKNALEDASIIVLFICEEYVRLKYFEKFGE